jgi:hypothetical protein
MDGGALQSNTFKNLLNASYSGQQNVGDFVLDKSVSSGTSKVYHNPKTNQTVVAHRGTKGVQDWVNNAVYGLFGKTGYKMTPRFKEAEKVQKEAQEKYGAKNISTIGSSQGGLQAELLGKDTHEVITHNKATRPFESKAGENQFDVRAKSDIVSALNPFRQKTGKEIEYESVDNPIEAHKVSSINLPEEQMIGRGLFKIQKHGKCFSVVNTETGRVHSKCSTKANATKQMRLLYMLEKS